MKTATPPPRHTTWSTCSQLAELAILIDAIPAAFRSHLVEAALRTNGGQHHESYLVGELRSLIFDSVTQLYGPSLSRSCFCEHRDAAWIQLPTSLQDGADPAAIQLAVCDLMEELAVHLSYIGKEQHDG